jgi:hemolysin activation/secretion protein
MHRFFPKGPAPATSRRPCSLAAAIAYALPALILTAGANAAETAPDAGTILRQLQRDLPTLQAPAQPTVPLAPSAPAPILKQGQTVKVTAFRIIATLFPEATLKDVVKGYIGRDCTLGDLNEAAAKIAQFYRDHDYFAHAYLPPQKIENGLVTIEVLEGKLGKVVIDPASAARLSHDKASAYITAQQGEGEFLRPHQVEEGLANLAAVPGVAASTTLAPGAAPAQTDVIVKLDEGPLVSGTSLVDNGNSRATGSWRWVGEAALNDALGAGDQVAVTSLRSLGSKYVMVAADAPVGYSGLRLGADASGLAFRTDKRFNATQPSGSAVTYGLKALRPVWRDQDSVVQATVLLDHKRLTNETAGVAISDNAIDVATFKVAGSTREPWLDGITQFAAAVEYGTLDLSANPQNQAQDQASARTQGRFGKFDFDLTQTEQLTRNTEAAAILSGQLANKNLDSSEQFSLGGQSGVRAYPTGEARGDDGWLASLEYRYRPQAELQLAGFWDVGQIVQHAIPWAGWRGGSDQSNIYVLDGIGAWAEWHPVDWVFARVTVAHRLGINPGRSPAGYDSDGYHEHTRVWMQAGLTF